MSIVNPAPSATAAPAGRALKKRPSPAAAAAAGSDKPKRHRRTKAEMEALRSAQGGSTTPARPPAAIERPLTTNVAVKAAAPITLASSATSLQAWPAFSALEKMWNIFDGLSTNEQMAVATLLSERMTQHISRTNA